MGPTRFSTRLLHNTLAPQFRLILSVIFGGRSRQMRRRSTLPESILKTKTFQNWRLSMVTFGATSLFDLPAGGVGLALGGQFRRESLEENPDKLNVAGDIAGNSPVPGSSWRPEVYAFFAESRIPVFSTENAITGFSFSGIHGAGRFEAFRNNDTNVLVPRLAFAGSLSMNNSQFDQPGARASREPVSPRNCSAPLSTLFPSHDPRNGRRVRDRRQTRSSSATKI